MAMASAVPIPAPRPAAAPRPVPVRRQPHAAREAEGEVPRGQGRLRLHGHGRSRPRAGPTGAPRGAGSILQRVLLWRHGLGFLFAWCGSFGGRYDRAPAEPYACLFPHPIAWGNHGAGGGVGSAGGLLRAARCREPRPGLPWGRELVRVSMACSGAAEPVAGRFCRSPAPAHSRPADGAALCLASQRERGAGGSAAAGLWDGGPGANGEAKALPPDWLSQEGRTAAPRCASRWGRGRMPELPGGCRSHPLGAGACAGRAPGD